MAGLCAGSTAVRPPQPSAALRWTRMPPGESDSMSANPAGLQTAYTEFLADHPGYLGTLELDNHRVIRDGS